MRRGQGYLALGLSAALALGGLAAGAVAPRASGPEAPSPHPRVVSLNPCTDAILAEVADPDQIAALSRYSRDPAESSMDVRLARRWPVTDEALEDILAHHPQLVVNGGYTPPATAAAMARLGLPLVEVGIAENVPQSFAQIRRIAALVGHRDRGEALVARIRAALADAAPPLGMAPVSALVWQGGGLTAGRGTLIDDLLSRTGFANVAIGMAGAGRTVSLEQVLANPPEVILPVTRDGQLADEDRLLAHPALAKLAYSHRFALDPSVQWCGGPSIIAAVARLAAIRRAVRGESEGGGA